MSALIDFGFLINTKGYEIGVNSRAYKVSDIYYYNLELREYLLEESSIVQKTHLVIIFSKKFFYLIIFSRLYKFF